MKIKFDPNLDFQNEAIASIVDIFKGSTICQTNFTVSNIDCQEEIHMGEGELQGIGNKINTNFDEDDILKNVQDIQLRNRLPQSTNIKKGEYNFTIEMETGTGKTFVYLRTIFELNKKYGFTKFIIVVPSVAIKEGVIKSIEMTRQDFKQWYDNVIFASIEYKSKDIENIRNFAVDNNINIMIMTIQSFNKSSNVINKEHERTNGVKPIDFINDTNPVVIIDEPQTTTGTDKSKEAVKSLNPICTIGYSATHKEKNNLMFKLDSIDAYERKLVKQIQVASVTSKNNNNDDYIKVISIGNKKNSITAKIEIDIMKNNVIKRKILTIKHGDDLFELSGSREQYKGYLITEINASIENEFIEINNKGKLKLNDVCGEINDDIIKREQIKETIKEHLEKELKIKKKNIKVLSLFFIDKVEHYRVYNDDGTTTKGKYALWFEEEFNKLIKEKKYKTLLNNESSEAEAKCVHNGYFAKDKKGKLKNTTGKTEADEDIYSLIMKDKEKLLSFESKLKFIFTHSALKEGWDNPNVFQICTLNETKSPMKKRQEIGRGLRLAVDQNGERTEGFGINTLTIFSNESYEEFSKKLQKEIEEDSGIKFGIIKKHTFANINIVDENGLAKCLNQIGSEKIWEHLKEEEYIDNKGKIKDKLKYDLKEGKVNLPEEYEDYRGKIINEVKKVVGILNIRDRSEKKELKINKRRFLSPEFKELWNKIKYKSTYSVEFDTENLIKVCAEEIKSNLKFNKVKVLYEKNTIAITESGIKGKEGDRYTKDIDDAVYVLPDIIYRLQNSTNLTRKTLVRILKESKQIEKFKENPEAFIEGVTKIIQYKMKEFIIDGIKYEKLDNEFYAQEMFESEELSGYLKKNIMESEKSVYDHVIYDSEVEAEFARKFENSNRVKVYAKLPNWFKIETPLGNYNPDWAILIEKDQEEKLYFVVETKGDISTEQLRSSEIGKIECGKKHFKAINTDIRFELQDDFNNFIENI